MNQYTPFATAKMIDMTTGALVGYASFKLEMDVLHWYLVVPTKESVTAQHIHADNSGQPGAMEIPLPLGFAKGNGNETQTIEGEISTSLGSVSQHFLKLEELLTKKSHVMVHTKERPSGAYSGVLVPAEI